MKERERMCVCESERVRESEGDSTCGTDRARKFKKVLES